MGDLFPALMCTYTYPRFDLHYIPVSAVKHSPTAIKDSMMLNVEILKWNIILSMTNVSIRHLFKGIDTVEMFGVPQWSSQSIVSTCYLPLHPENKLDLLASMKGSARDSLPAWLQFPYSFTTEQKTGLVAAYMETFPGKEPEHYLKWIPDETEQSL